MLFFSKQKSTKKASGTATPEAARPAARNSQISAFRALPCPALVFAQTCQSLTAFGSCARSGHTLPLGPSLVCGSRTVGRPQSIRVVQFRPKGRNSLTTFRGQTALRGCPRARGVPVSHSSLPVALLASHPPCGSLWAAPQGPTGATLPFGTVRCAHPPGKSPLLPIFDGGSSQRRAQLELDSVSPTVWSALVLSLFLFQNGRGFFPPLPIAALLCRSWHWADSNGAAWDVSMRIAWLRSTEKRA